MAFAMANHAPGKFEPSLQARHGSCHDCRVGRLCLPFSLEAAEVNRLEGIIKYSRPLHKYEYLTHAGDPVQYVYALRSGAFKTYLLNPDGIDQIISFHLPGELIGLDAIGAVRYPSYSVALETSQVCSIPLHQLEELAGLIPSLRRQLLEIMGREIRTEYEHQSHARESAEQRLVAFLLNLSARYSKRGLSASNFVLPMGRSDIGNYLGMTTETVSRLFSRFRDLQLIDSVGREVRLRNIPALRRQGHSSNTDHF